LTTTDDVNVTGQLTINWLTGNGTPSPGPGILANTANIYDIGESGTRFRSGYFSGNVYAGNIINSGSSSVTGNITGNNLLTINGISANGNIVGNFFIGNGSQLTGITTTYGNANVANYLPTFSGNLTAGNISATGTIISKALVTNNQFKNLGIEISAPNYITISSNAQSANLSTTTSTNFIVANNTGYTCYINLPASPVDGQIAIFSIAGNTITLAPGTGNVNSPYTGSTSVGTGFKYIYRQSGNVWFKSV